MHHHLDLVELVATLNAAHVASRAHVLAAEASRVRNVPPRQRLNVEDLVTMDADELRFSCRYQPNVVVLVAIEVFVEVRQMGAAQKRLALCHEGRIDLGESR